MSNITTDLAPYLLALKQAYEFGEMSSADCKAVHVIFAHGLFYQSLLGYEVLHTEKAFAAINTFCNAIEESLPAPEITDKTPLLFLLGTGRPNPNSLDKLTPDMQARASQEFAEVVIDLMSIFQTATLELSLSLQNVDALSTVDINNVHYVIGMSEITACNFGTVLQGVEHFDMTGYRAMQELFVNGTQFAAALKQRGLGVINS
jgi:hypothetical protein